MIEDLIVALRNNDSVESFSIIYSKELGKYIAVIEVSGDCTSTISVTHHQATIALRTASSMFEALHNVSGGGTQ